MKISVLVVLCLSLVGCVGQQARQNALYPAMDLAWPGVRADAQYGVEVAEAGVTTPNLAAFELLLENRDSVGLIAQWPLVETFAVNGVEAKVNDEAISLGVADSLLERIDGFELSVQELARSP